MSEKKILSFEDFQMEIRLAQIEKRHREMQQSARHEVEEFEQQSRADASLKPTLAQITNMIDLGFVCLGGGKECESTEGKITALEYQKKIFNEGWTRQTHSSTKLVICPARDVCQKREAKGLTFPPCLYLALKLDLLMREAEKD